MTVTASDILPTPQDSNASVEIREEADKFIIKVTSEDGSTWKEYTLNITIDNNFDLESITPDETSILLDVGELKQITYTLNAAQNSCYSFTKTSTTAHTPYSPGIPSNIRTPHSHRSQYDVPCKSREKTASILSTCHSGSHRRIHTYGDTSHAVRENAYPARHRSILCPPV